MSLQEDIQEIWRRVKHRYEPSSEPPSTPAEIIDAEQRLARYYAALGAAPRDFAFPEALKEFLSIVGPERCCSGSYGSGPYGFYWYPADMVHDDTVLLTDLWWDSYTPEIGLWACIAHWSDKHEIWICCEPKHPRYGEIVDCHDGHPWAAQDQEAPSLAEFLQGWGAWHDKP